MTFTDFISTYNGKGVDFDGAFGDQCMDLAEQYNKDVVGAPRLGGNAVDVWTKYPTANYDKVTNGPTNFPQQGDIVIWGTAVGEYGHIAVCESANANSFTSFDQNWPVGSICHHQAHTYNGVLGWLRPKKPVSTAPTGNPCQDKDDRIQQLDNQINTLQNSLTLAQNNPKTVTVEVEHTFTNPLAKALYSLALQLDGKS